VNPLIEPLRNKITVPCDTDEILRLWKASGTLSTIWAGFAEGDEVKLLPLHFDQGPPGVLQDLKDLGVLDYISDGRIQMPDVYRIAFGLGRNGGVKPLK
jgi:hypothetical protein